MDIQFVLILKSKAAFFRQRSNFWAYSGYKNSFRSCLKCLPLERDLSVASHHQQCIFPFSLKRCFCLIALAVKMCIPIWISIIQCGHQQLVLSTILVFPSQISVTMLPWAISLLNSINLLLWACSEAGAWFLYIVVPVLNLFSHSHLVFLH